MPRKKKGADRMPDQGEIAETNEHADPAADPAVDVLEAAAIAEEQARAARRELEILYGKQLGKLKEKVDSWRSKQVNEAFSISDLWRKLEKEMPCSNVAAFLSSECQIPRRDVARYARMVEVLGEQRKVFADHGVAVSVLLDLAHQGEAVRAEALSMILSGRSLQAKELNGLKRDIALAEAAREGRPDPERARAFKTSAAKRARDAASAWLVSLEELAMS